jgi:hypothetical protein
MMTCPVRFNAGVTCALKPSSSLGSKGPGNSLLLHMGSKPWRDRPSHSHQPFGDAGGGSTSCYSRLFNGVHISSFQKRSQDGVHS